MPTSDEKPDIIDPKTVKKSRLLTFELPPETGEAGGFVGDESAETSQTDETAETPQTDEQAEAEKYRGTPDDKGNPYDPLIHAYPPEKTGKLGKWKRRPKAATARDSETKSNAAYRASAEQLAALYGNAHVTLFGKDGRIMARDDLMPMVDAFERYAQTKGMDEISPGYASLLAMLNYSVGVCSRPTVAEKLKRWFSPIWKTVKGWFGFREPPKTPHAPIKKPKQEPEQNADNYGTPSQGQF